MLVLEEKKILIRLPLHNLEGIVTFGYTGVSPALMGACAKRGISLSFMNPNGQFLASVSGENKGNVILRKQQYRISDSLEDSIPIARNMIIGKIYNSKWVLERATRDHAMQVDVDAIKKDGKIQFSIKNISENPLNFQADELTERFIRGDVSRSTEGSGLGLSIAKNLTVLQHGTFNIYLDGDLFKVTITFDEAVKEKKPMSPMIVPEPVQEEAQQDV